jgi:hypothetical protein
LICPSCWWWPFVNALIHFCPHSITEWLCR